MVTLLHFRHLNLNLISSCRSRNIDKMSIKNGNPDNPFTNRFFAKLLEREVSSKLYHLIYTINEKDLLDFRF